MSEEREGGEGKTGEVEVLEVREEGRTGGEPVG